MPPHNRPAVITMTIDAAVGATDVIIGIVGNKDATVELHSKEKLRKLQIISSIIQANMTPPLLTSH